MKEKIVRWILFYTCLLIVIIPIVAQDMPRPEVISIENVHRLQPVAHIDFADYDCEFGSGRFSLSDSGDYLAAQDTSNHVYLWDASSKLLQSSTSPCDDIHEPYHIAFDDVDMMYVFHQRDNTIVVSQMHPRDDVRSEGVIYPIDGQVLSAWVDNDSIWLEVREDNTEAIIFAENAFVAPDEYEVYSYAPSQDTEAVVRVGRIPPPYTVTSSRDAIVTLWNIQTGEVIYEVDNGTSEASVFGAINADATHFVWRDNLNETLYLLDFETGNNQPIADLDGQYAQWYFLNPDARVAIAVNLGFEPNIVAWDTETGERRDLGNYRDCGRPQPDMARLSADGTTLVIGCDTGLDIWRIADEE